MIRTDHQFTFFHNKKYLDLSLFQVFIIDQLTTNPLNHYIVNCLKYFEVDD